MKKDAGVPGTDGAEGLLGGRSAFVLFACAGLVLYSALLTNIFTGDDMVHFFERDYRPWFQNFSNHGRLGQGVLVLLLQAFDFNLIRQQILGRAAAILLLAASAHALYRACLPRVKGPEGRALALLGSFLAVFNVYTVELVSYSMAALTYSVSLFFSVFAATRLAKGFARGRLAEAFALMFAAFWFYQNTPPYFVGLSLLFLLGDGLERGERPRVLLERAGILFAMYLAASAVNLVYVTKVHGLLFHTPHNPRVSLDPAVPFRMFGGTLLRTGWYFLTDYGLPTGRVTAGLTAAAFVAAAVSCRRARGALAALFACVVVVVLLSVAPNALNSEYYVPARSIPAVGGLVGFLLLFAALRAAGARTAAALLGIGLLFAACVGLDASRVAAAVRVSNRLDIERAKRICALIAEGERAQGAAVRKVLFVPDLHPTPAYPGLRSFPDTSLSLLATSWSRNPLLKFVSGRAFQTAEDGYDAGLVERIRRSDRSPFVDPEQVFVKGDVAYIVIP